MSPERGPGELNRHDCLSRLVRGHLGRIAVSVRSLPTIVPVSYLVDGDEIMVRTVAEERVRRAVYDNVVTFQVDDLEAGTDERWSVSVTGIARPTGGGIGHHSAREAPLAAAIPTVLIQGMHLGGGWLRPVGPG
jgi:nitroimidazol reductase NimA-like FMN-containing flavoprotein (pyridoxamine 5'-phosphate oxidase superfamily)